MPALLAVERLEGRRSVRVEVIGQSSARWLVRLAQFDVQRVPLPNGRVLVGRASVFVPKRAVRFYGAAGGPA